jgi:predicted RNase H-like nuclease
VVRRNIALAGVSIGIPAWTRADVSPVAAIEVYPAATLVAHWIRSTGYKKPDQTEERREIVAALRRKLTIGESVPDLAISADLVDAAVCVLAGDDFIAGRAMNPENRGLAEREGWIWTAAPKS